MIGENCSARCTTKDHQSFGECMRAKGLRVAYCQSAAGKDATAQKKWDARLDSYRDAKSQGINPQGTKTNQIRQALDISDVTGQAFNPEARPLNG